MRQVRAFEHSGRGWVDGRLGSPRFYWVPKRISQTTALGERAQTIRQQNALMKPSGEMYGIEILLSGLSWRAGWELGRAAKKESLR